MTARTRSRKIALLAYGSRGDVEPFLALAQGLNHAGHQTRLAAPGVFADLAAARDVAFVSLPGDPDHLVAELVQRAGRRPDRVVRVMSRFVFPLAVDVLQSALDVCRDVDVVVHSFLFTSGGHEVAVQMGIPDISAQLFPVFTPTAAFPGVVAPDLPLGNAYRRFSHRLIQQVFWQGSQVLYNRLRKTHTALPALSGWPIGSHLQPPVPVLYAHSPHVLPKPDDWPDWAHVTGYWFEPDVRSPEIPDGLEAFLEAGSAPIYIGFGSVISRDAGRLMQIVLEALRRTGQRGVVLRKQQDEFQSGPHRNVFFLHSIRHDWLFPKMAAAVHHGGAGTTGASLRAGLPTLIVPFTNDQPFWGRQVQRLGVGPASITPRRLTVERLAAAIERMLTDVEMRTRARVLGEKIRMDDGIGEAVACIEAACGLKGNGINPVD